MFKLYKSEEIENIGTGYVYDHNSGCRLIYIKNEDENRVFTIAFNTLPENDKGIPHIVEHCVLCGSENYRVKDPFNILDKGSIHTYLNAMTYRDKTVYPVGSTNEGDFKTLMRVYCDAVFSPQMYTNEGIFRQEGWNSDGKEYNGIVLNEMKGVYSDPAVVLSEALNKEMFKDCGYGNDSGGNPEFITDLSYEEFLDFHRKHYHPSNAIIYLYGKLDIKEYLDILEKEYLSKFEYRERKKNPPVISRDKSEIEIRHNTGGKNLLSAAFNTGGSCNGAKCLMLEVLATMLCYTEGGNIKEAVLSAGLGDKVNCGFDDSTPISVMDITVENSDENDIKKFKNIINNVFKDIAENGVDEYKLRGVINSIKFFFMEEDFGYRPKGLFYGLMIIKNFLIGGESFEPIRINKLFEEMEKIDIKELVKEYFVDKGCYGILIADNQAETKEKPVCEKNNEPLISYQAQSDSEEEVQKLMATKVMDISKVGYKLKFEENDGNIFVPLDTDEIVYIDIYFDVTDCIKTTALSAYRAIADVYNEKLSNDIDYYTGGMSVEITTLQRDNEYRPVMVFRIKCLRENTEKSLELFKKIILQHFDDRDRISRLIMETKQSVKMSYIESGNVKAVLEALAGVSAASLWESSARGIDYYNYLNSSVDVIMNDVNDVTEVFKRGNVFYAFAGGKSDENWLLSLIEKNLSCLDRGGEKHILSSDKKGENKGIIIDSNVNFNAAAFEMSCVDGIERVVQQAISREYLWDKIRIEGGAYGGGCVLGKRYSYMYSYRDPNFERTFDVFKRAGEYIASKRYSQSDIDRFIIGTINEIDKPVKKHMLTRLAMKKYFASEDKNLAVKRREQILSAVPSDITAFGEKLVNAGIKGICSVGQEKDIKSCQIFKELYRID